MHIDPDHLTIRAATDADGNAVAHLIAGVFAEYDGCPFVFDEFPELAAPAGHFAAHGGALFLLVTDTDRVVGSVGYSRPEPGVAELHKLYLVKELRGRGLAGRLFAEVTAALAGSDIRAIRLWTDTRFESGHRFYERLGFRRQPATRFLADATNAWEYAYRLDLGGDAPAP